MPAAVTGAHFGSYSSVRLLGSFADGTPFQCYDSGHGGWGASAGHDGSGPFRTMAHGDSRIIPVELQESMYPYRLEEFSLREDSAGADASAAGLDSASATAFSAPCRLSVNFERHVCPPWGVTAGCRRNRDRPRLQRRHGRARHRLQIRTLPTRSWRRRARRNGRRRRVRTAPRAVARRGATRCGTRLHHRPSCSARLPFHP